MKIVHVLTDVSGFTQAWTPRVLVSIAFGTRSWPRAQQLWWTSSTLTVDSGDNCPGWVTWTSTRMEALVNLAASLMHTKVGIAAVKSFLGTNKRFSILHRYWIQCQIDHFVNAITGVITAVIVNTSKAPSICIHAVMFLISPTMMNHSHLQSLPHTRK